jgi:hypothetical protein
MFEAEHSTLASSSSRQRLSAACNVAFATLAGRAFAVVAFPLAMIRFSSTVSGLLVRLGGVVTHPVEPL